jgi:hypothetical protein
MPRLLVLMGRQDKGQDKTKLKQRPRQDVTRQGKARINIRQDKRQDYTRYKSIAKDQDRSQERKEPPTCSASVSLRTRTGTRTRTSKGVRLWSVYSPIHLETKATVRPLFWILPFLESRMPPSTCSETLISAVAGCDEQPALLVMEGGPVYTRKELRQARRWASSTMWSPAMSLNTKMQMHVLTKYELYFSLEEITSNWL